MNNDNLVYSVIDKLDFALSKVISSQYSTVFKSTFYKNEINPFFYGKDWVVPIGLKSTLKLRDGLKWIVTSLQCAWLNGFCIDLNFTQFFTVFVGTFHKN